MSEFESILPALGQLIVAGPALLVAVLGCASLFSRRLSEPAVCRLVQAATVSGLVASLAVLAIMLTTGVRHIPVEAGHWVVVDGFHFSLKFVFDRLSVPFAILSFALCGTIGAFARKYMHQEPGFNRFFFQYSIFLLGMVVTSLADTIETLFTGWELVGLSSALLVSFFHERPAPAQNGLRVWCVYRVSDAALLAAALTLHHMAGEGDFDSLLGTAANSPGWPLGTALISSRQAFIVGLLLLVAAAGKSALLPFSGWLPRAMEGPTPSSAVFYGALSVHLGAFLLLRAGPLIEASPALCALIVVLGLATAAYAAVAGRVQSDIKSALSFASLTQVGLIVAEIGLGLRYVALVHILGHACLRTLQFLRAPTLLHDYHMLEDAIGEHLPRLGGPFVARLPESLRLWVYRFGLERGYLDAALDRLVAAVLGAFRKFDLWERRWTDFLSGGPPRKPDREPAAEALDHVS